MDIVNLKNLNFLATSFEVLRQNQEHLINICHFLNFIISVTDGHF
jgi:hypothetical protein